MWGVVGLERKVGVLRGRPEVLVWNPTGSDCSGKFGGSKCDRFRVMDVGIVGWKEEVLLGRVLSFRWV